MQRGTGPALFTPGEALLFRATRAEQTWLPWGAPNGRSNSWAYWIVNLVEVPE